MPYLHLDGCDLYYETAGHGPALVFAHGLGGNHMSWWQQVPHFRDRYTCVTFAHRGFAPSREAVGGPGPAAFIDDIEALIEHLGFEDVRLVAQSMGGMAALGYALRHPERVRALVLAATGGATMNQELRRIFVEHRARNLEAPLFAKGIHPAAGERMAREQPDLHFLYWQISDLSDDLDREALRAKALAQPRNSPEEVAALGVPILCVTGEEDVVVPTEAIELLASLIGARLERVPEAGHSVYFERAATFNRLVDEFLVTV
ncbi:MAG: alpha/beta hydrolase [Dehalococcoidia bacterium]